MAFIPGDQFDNDLKGTGDPDTIQAMEGDDTLTGRGGNDTLTAGTGDDRLFGGDGADTLKDGFGVDRFTGGRGADIFQFVRLEGLGGVEKDIVLDYRDGVDRIDLRELSPSHDGLIVSDTRNGDVRLTLGGRVILLKDHDGTLDAADITLSDFL